MWSAIFLCDTALYIHRLLIFISCNIYRGAIAVRRRGKKSRALANDFRDVRRYRVGGKKPGMQINARVNAPLSDHLSYIVSIDLIVEWK